MWYVVFGRVCIVLIVVPSSLRCDWPGDSWFVFCVDPLFLVGGVVWFVPTSLLPGLSIVLLL